MSSRFRTRPWLSALVLPCLALTSLNVCAQPAEPAVSTAPAAGVAAVPGTAAHAVRQAILTISPDVIIDRIAPAALPGFQEVVVGGQVMYVSDDGQYLIQGSLYDLTTRTDLSVSALAAVRRQLLAAIPAAEKIVFAPKQPKYTVTVFTDVECGYCRRLHSQIADYNRRGIAVEYLAYPRQGLNSDDYRTMVSVWCAADRNKALTDAKNNRPVPRRECANPVAAQYALGNRLGLTGTPMIVTAAGVAMPGYVPPDALEEMLRTLDEAQPQAAAD